MRRKRGKKWADFSSCSCCLSLSATRNRLTKRRSYGGDRKAVFCSMPQLPPHALDPHPARLSAAVGPGALG